jgi:hypothetical protein
MPGLRRSEPTTGRTHRTDQFRAGGTAHAFAARRSRPILGNRIVHRRGSVVRGPLAFSSPRACRGCAVQGRRRAPLQAASLRARAASYRARAPEARRPLRAKSRDPGCGGRIATRRHPDRHNRDSRWIAARATAGDRRSHNSGSSWLRRRSDQKLGLCSWSQNRFLRLDLPMMGRCKLIFKWTGSAACRVDER